MRASSHAPHVCLCCWVSTLHGLVTAGFCRIQTQTAKSIFNTLPKSIVSRSHAIRAFRACLAITKRKPTAAAGQQQSTNPSSPTFRGPRSASCVATTALLHRGLRTATPLLRLCTAAMNCQPPQYRLCSAATDRCAAYWASWHDTLPAIRARSPQIATDLLRA